MALTGAHIACGYAGALNSPRILNQPLPGKLVWSQTMAAAGTTTNSAPGASDPSGDPVAVISASLDIYVAAGPAPDATAGARYFVPAGQRFSFYVSPGDKIAWIAA